MSGNFAKNNTLTNSFNDEQLQRMQRQGTVVPSSSAITSRSGGNSPGQQQQQQQGRNGDSPLSPIVISNSTNGQAQLLETAGSGVSGSSPSGSPLASGQQSNPGFAAVVSASPRHQRRGSGSSSIAPTQRFHEHSVASHAMGGPGASQSFLSALGPNTAAVSPTVQISSVNFHNPNPTDSAGMRREQSDDYGSLMGRVGLAPPIPTLVSPSEDFSSSPPAPSVKPDTLRAVRNSASSNNLIRNNASANTIWSTDTATPTIIVNNPNAELVDPRLLSAATQPDAIRDFSEALARADVTDSEAEFGSGAQHSPVRSDYSNRNRPPLPYSPPQSSASHMSPGGVFGASASNQPDTGGLRRRLPSATTLTSARSASRLDCMLPGLDLNMNATSPSPFQQGSPATATTDTPPEEGGPNPHQHSQQQPASSPTTLPATLPVEPTVSIIGFPQSSLQAGALLSTSDHIPSGTQGPSPTSANARPPYIRHTANPVPVSVVGGPPSVTVGGRGRNAVHYGDAGDEEMSEVASAATGRGSTDGMSNRNSIVNPQRMVPTSSSVPASAPPYRVSPPPAVSSMTGAAASGGAPLGTSATNRHDPRDNSFSSFYFGFNNNNNNASMANMSMPNAAASNPNANKRGTGKSGNNSSTAAATTSANNKDNLNFLFSTTFGSARQPVLRLTAPPTSSVSTMPLLDASSNGNGSGNNNNVSISAVGMSHQQQAQALAAAAAVSTSYLAKHRAPNNNNASTQRPFLGKSYRDEANGDNASAPAVDRNNRTFHPQLRLEDSQHVDDDSELQTANGSTAIVPRIGGHQHLRGGPNASETPTTTLSNTGTSEDGGASFDDEKVKFAAELRAFTKKKRGCRLSTLLCTVFLIIITLFILFLLSILLNFFDSLRSYANSSIQSQMSMLMFGLATVDRSYIQTILAIQLNAKLYEDSTTDGVNSTDGNASLVAGALADHNALLVASAAALATSPAGRAATTAATSYAAQAIAKGYRRAVKSFSGAVADNFGPNDEYNITNTTNATQVTPTNPATTTTASGYLSDDIDLTIDQILSHIALCGSFSSAPRNVRMYSKNMTVEMSVNCELSETLAQASGAATEFELGTTRAYNALMYGPHPLGLGDDGHISAIFQPMMRTDNGDRLLKTITDIVNITNPTNYSEILDNLLLPPYWPDPNATKAEDMPPNPFFGGHEGINYADYFDETTSSTYKQLVWSLIIPSNTNINGVPVSIANYSFLDAIWCTRMRDNHNYVAFFFGITDGRTVSMLFSKDDLGPMFLLNGNVKLSLASIHEAFVGILFDVDDRKYSKNPFYARYRDSYAKFLRDPNTILNAARDPSAYTIANNYGGSVSSPNHRKFDIASLVSDANLTDTISLRSTYTDPTVSFHSLSDDYDTYAETSNTTIGAQLNQYFVDICERGTKHTWHFIRDPSAGDSSATGATITTTASDSKGVFRDSVSSEIPDPYIINRNLIPDTVVLCGIFCYEEYANATRCSAGTDGSIYVVMTARVMDKTAQTLASAMSWATIGVCVVLLIILVFVQAAVSVPVAILQREMVKSIVNNEEDIAEDAEEKTNNGSSNNDGAETTGGNDTEATSGVDGDEEMRPIGPNGVAITPEEQEARRLKKLKKEKKLRKKKNQQDQLKRSLSYATHQTQSTSKIRMYYKKFRRSFQYYLELVTRPLWLGEILNLVRLFKVASTITVITRKHTPEHVLSKQTAHLKAFIRSVDVDVVGMSVKQLVNRLEEIEMSKESSNRERQYGAAGDERASEHLSADTASSPTSEEPFSPPPGGTAGGRANLTNLFFSSTSSYRGRNSTTGMNIISPNDDPDAGNSTALVPIGTGNDLGRADQSVRHPTSYASPPDDFHPQRKSNIHGFDESGRYQEHDLNQLHSQTNVAAGPREESAFAGATLSSKVRASGRPVSEHIQHVSRAREGVEQDFEFSDADDDGGARSRTIHGLGHNIMGESHYGHTLNDTSNSLGWTISQPPDQRQAEGESQTDAAPGTRKRSFRRSSNVEHEDPNIQSTNNKRGVSFAERNTQHNPEEQANAQRADGGPMPSAADPNAQEGPAQEQSKFSQFKSVALRIVSSFTGLAGGNNGNESSKSTKASGKPPKPPKANKNPKAGNANSNTTTAATGPANVRGRNGMLLIGAPPTNISTNLNSTTNNGKTDSNNASGVGQKVNNSSFSDGSAVGESENDRPFGGGGGGNIVVSGLVSINQQQHSATRNSVVHPAEISASGNIISMRPTPNTDNNVFLSPDDENNNPLGGGTSGLTRVPSQGGIFSGSDTAVGRGGAGLPNALSATNTSASAIRMLAAAPDGSYDFNHNRGGNATTFVVGPRHGHDDNQQHPSISGAGSPLPDQWNFPSNVNPAASLNNATGYGASNSHINRLSDDSHRNSVASNPSATPNFGLDFHPPSTAHPNINVNNTSISVQNSLRNRLVGKGDNLSIKVAGPNSDLVGVSMGQSLTTNPYAPGGGTAAVSIPASPTGVPTVIGAGFGGLPTSVSRRAIMAPDPNASVTNYYGGADEPASPTMNQAPQELFGKSIIMTNRRRPNSAQPQPVAPLQGRHDKMKDKEATIVVVKLSTIEPAYSYDFGNAAFQHNRTFTHLLSVFRNAHAEVFYKTGEMIAAAWNAFDSKPDHIRAGTRCAVEIARQFAPARRNGFRMGIGVHTGQVICGQLEDKNSSTSVVLGANVELAVQLSELAVDLPYFSVLITDAVRTVVSIFYDSVIVDVIKREDRSGGIDVFDILGPKQNYSKLRNNQNNGRKNKKMLEQEKKPCIEEEVRMELLLQYNNAFSRFRSHQFDDALDIIYSMKEMMRDPDILNEIAANNGPPISLLAITETSSSTHSSAVLERLHQLCNFFIRQKTLIQIASQASVAASTAAAVAAANAAIASAAASGAIGSIAALSLGNSGPLGYLGVGVDGVGQDASLTYPSQMAGSSGSAINRASITSTATAEAMENATREAEEKITNLVNVVKMSEFTILPHPYSRALPQWKIFERMAEEAVLNEMQKAQQQKLASHLPHHRNRTASLPPGALGDTATSASNPQVASNNTNNMPPSTTATYTSSSGGFNSAQNSASPRTSVIANKMPMPTAAAAGGVPIPQPAANNFNASTSNARTLSSANASTNVVPPAYAIAGVDEANNMSLRHVGKAGRGTTHGVANQVLVARSQSQPYGIDVQASSNPETPERLSQLSNSRIDEGNAVSIAGAFVSDRATVLQPGRRVRAQPAALSDAAALDQNYGADLRTPPNQDGGESPSPARSPSPASGSGSISYMYHHNDRPTPLLLPTLDQRGVVSVGAAALAAATPSVLLSGSRGPDEDQPPPPVIPLTPAPKRELAKSMRSSEGSGVSASTIVAGGSVVGGLLLDSEATPTLSAKTPSSALTPTTTTTSRQRLSPLTATNTPLMPNGLPLLPTGSMAEAASNEGSMNKPPKSGSGLLTVSEASPPKRSSSRNLFEESAAKSSKKSSKEGGAASPSSVLTLPDPQPSMLYGQPISNFIAQLNSAPMFLTMDAVDKVQQEREEESAFKRELRAAGKVTRAQRSSNNQGNLLSGASSGALLSSRSAASAAKSPNAGDRSAHHNNNNNRQDFAKTTSNNEVAHATSAAAKNGGGGGQLSSPPPDMTVTPPSHNRRRAKTVTSASRPNLSAHHSDAELSDEISHHEGEGKRPASPTSGKRNNLNLHIDLSKVHGTDQKSRSILGSPDCQQRKALRRNSTESDGSLLAISANNSPTHNKAHPSTHQLLPITLQSASCVPGTLVQGVASVVVKGSTTTTVSVLQYQRAMDDVQQDDSFVSCDNSLDSTEDYPRRQPRSAPARIEAEGEAADDTFVSCSNSLESHHSREKRHVAPMKSNSGTKGAKGRAHERNSSRYMDDGDEDIATDTTAVRLYHGTTPRRQASGNAKASPKTRKSPKSARHDHVATDDANITTMVSMTNSLMSTASSSSRRSSSSGDESDQSSLASVDVGLGFKRRSAPTAASRKAMAEIRQSSSLLEGTSNAEDSPTLPKTGRKREVDTDGGNAKPMHKHRKSKGITATGQHVSSSAAAAAAMSASISRSLMMRRAKEADADDKDPNSNSLSNPAGQSIGTAHGTMQHFTETFQSITPRLLPQEVTTSDGTIYSRSDTMLGAGSYGKVFLGMEKHTAKLVAMKFMPLPDDPLEIDSLQNEVLTMKQVRDTYLVEFYGYCLTPPFIVLIMECVVAGSLSSMLKSFHAFEPQTVVNFMKHVLRGLLKLHHEGIIHRDVKPQNVLVTTTGICKISDFGASARISALARSAHDGIIIQGTPLYLAPEAARGQPVLKSDIWSVGIMFLQLVTGKLPFEVDDAIIRNPVLFAYNIAQGRIRPVIPPRGSLAAPALEFVAKCLEDDVEKRLSAEELLALPFFLVSY